MLRPLRPEILKIRSDFLRDVRSFFFENDYLEVETPLLNPTGGFEPFLDPLRVMRAGVRKSAQVHADAPGPEADKHTGWLITSPEYNLKITLADYPGKIFQIAHCFREGDRGDLHSEEFLMLEWYHPGADEFRLMDETRELLRFLASRPYSRRDPELCARARVRTTSVEEITRERAGCGLSRAELEAAVIRGGWLGVGESVADLRYDELFFSVFLNRIEAKLGIPEPEFLHSYPRELSALAVIEGNIARRFELYWQGVELANGYHELRDAAEQMSRFESENELRARLGKPQMRADEQFIAALEKGLPEMSGIALGLERLLMVLLGRETLEGLTPFI